MEAMVAVTMAAAGGQEVFAGTVGISGAVVRSRLSRWAGLAAGCFRFVQRFLPLNHWLILGGLLKPPLTSSVGRPVSPLNRTFGKSGRFLAAG